MEILLFIFIVIIAIGMGCSIYNNEYKEWKLKKEAEDWYFKKYGRK